MSRIWKFGDDIDTDQIVPGRYAPYMTGDSQVSKYAFVEHRPDFAPNVKPGDVIVTGKNFGCGSSREYAAVALRQCSPACIIAGSYARIFFRNCINLGIRLYEAPDDVRAQLEDGAEVIYNPETDQLVSNGKVINLKPMPEFVHQIVAEGGILEYVRKHGRFPGEEA